MYWEMLDSYTHVVVLLNREQRQLGTTHRRNKLYDIHDTLNMTYRFELLQVIRARREISFLKTFCEIWIFMSAAVTKS